MVEAPWREREGEEWMHCWRLCFNWTSFTCTPLLIISCLLWILFTSHLSQQGLNRGVIPRGDREQCYHPLEVGKSKSIKSHTNWVDIPIMSFLAGHEENETKANHRETAWIVVVHYWRFSSCTFASFILCFQYIYDQR